MPNQPDQDLQTPYVFIDTEAFIRAQCDWEGRLLSRLVSFARQGGMRLLTTAITKGEVCCYLDERLREAVSAAKKHGIILTQMGGSSVLENLISPEASRRLKQAFDNFLSAAQVIDVPTAVSLDTIIADYFESKPPFSDRKKSEFPDAFVMASLKAWCAKKSAKAYVVSNDRDLESCCSASGPLIHIASIEDIISRATVSQQLHDALQKALSECEELNDRLSAQLCKLNIERGDLRLSRFSGTVENVYDIDVCSLSVLDRDGTKFTCEIEFEVRLDLWLRLEEEGPRYEDHNLDSQRSRRKRSVYRMFTAEVVVEFDPETDVTCLESVYLEAHSLELDVNDVLDR